MPAGTRPGRIGEPVFKAGRWAADRWISRISVQEKRLAEQSAILLARAEQGQYEMHPLRKKIRN